MRPNVDDIVRLTQQPLLSDPAVQAQALEADTPEPLTVSVSAMAVPNGDAWPDPTPITTELLPVAPLPLSIIPAPLRPWIQDVTERMQCPPDFVAAAMVVMISAIIGAGCGIRPKQRDEIGRAHV